VEWNEAAKAIPPEPLKVFKRVAETYDGEAVSQVEEQEAGTPRTVVAAVSWGSPPRASTC